MNSNHYLKKEWLDIFTLSPIVLVALLSLVGTQVQAATDLQSCQETCKISLTESIPDGLTYNSSDATPYPSTFTVWMDLLAKANTTIEIAAYYWTLSDGTLGKFPTSGEGQKVFDELLLAGTKRQQTVKIAQSQPSSDESDTDTAALARQNAAEVRSLNFTRLVGGGILHTKFWLIDRTHAYIGSANSDWRSLTQVKEMGVYIQDCPCVAEDLGKIFDVYWQMGETGATVPDSWDSSLSTTYNLGSPMNLSSIGQFYLSSSPPSFCPSGRTGDITAITSTMGNATKFIYIAVMTYLPLFIYGEKDQYWDVIDTAIKTAAIDNGVEVRLLIGWWIHSYEDQKRYLRSLADISDNSTIKITAKLFVVPTTAEQSTIPYARVNHAKFMVTDNTAYIGTSNWSADYFTDTGGVGVVVEGDTELRQQLEDVFLRDWNSEYTYDITG